MRRIVVDARAFSDAMAKVSRVLKKSPLPILGEICVSVRDGICTLTATDLETWITARLPVQGDDLTFVFNRTKDVMKALAHMDGELVMELTERAENSKEPQKLRLYCAQRLAEYEVSSIKDYPEMVMVEADKVFRANAEHLLESIERVRYHLSLNADTDQYRCNLCGAHGNSVSLYARIKGISNAEAYRELVKESKVYPMPQQPTPQNSERQPVSLEQRHAAYSDMLDHLVLLDKHGENLLERGLSEERIRENGYRSMPETERGRRLLADLLRSHGHELCGLPGFRTYYGDWTISGPNGFLIPVRNKDGLIQGLKIRLDDADTPDRKYRWFSSRNMPNGTRSYSWVHVTGDTSRKRAFLTEGPLKGDVASHLANNELFICIGGVNALGGLTDTIRELGVREIVEAMDMDQMTNKNVRDAILTMRKEVKKIPGIRYSKYTWNPAYKGVDDYLLSRVAAM